VSVAAAAPRPAEPDGARKIVSILFADLVGSTGLHERLDPESARRFMESYYAAARAAVASHGGTVTQFLGDGVKAVFGIPRVAEDDAIRAVRAGVAMQDAFRALAEQQRAAVGETGLRVAVNTCEVVAKGETEIIGDPVNVAARLQERGRDGDVVIGESTQRLVASQVSLELLGSFDLKGRAVAVKAYRVVSLDPPRRAATTTFVGRAEELARISAVYDRAVATPATHLAVLIGSPGLGKSRLIGEFAQRSDATATIVAARCDAAGGATFAPLAAALREILPLDAGASTDSVRAAAEAVLPRESGDRSRVAAGIAGLLTGAPGAPEETFFVVRRFLAGIAATRPVVLLIDDLQWAEPLFLDLVEHLVQWGSDLPLLVLIGARPELREVRSSLATAGGLVADVVTLDGLDAGAATRLAAGVVGATDLPAAVAAKVLATSEGNPLYIAELVRMLVDEGALTRDGDRWTAGEALATVEMPPTIHALLAARIERLEPEECAVLERAAVVGRQFSRSSVAALLGNQSAELDARFESLQRAELIERDTGWFLGEPVLRFHHVLIRDAAYRRLLKGTRAELHEQLADWIEGQVGDASEHDETIGRHLEEAHRLLGELGPIDQAGRRLGERAAARLAAAGRRALAADDVPLAAGLLGRALDRLNPDDPARADLALDWCEALLAAGDVNVASAAIDELGRLARDSDRLRAWHTCFAGHHSVLTAPEQLSATADLVAEAATSLASLGDAAGEAKGHFVHALALSRLGQVGACEASLDRALAAARSAGDRRQANTVLAIAPLAALWGPSPVTRASGRCLDVVRVLRITEGAPAVEAVALSCQGVLEALRGRTDAAHRMLASAREMVEELGISQRMFETDVFAGFVALIEGDVSEAERNLRGAYDGLRDLGLGIDAARAAALLARAQLAQDRIAEAEELSHESEALAGDDLKAAIAWRGARAEALARRGEHAEAIEYARAAVAIAAATDALLDHADARQALAVALRAAGRVGEAANEERRAQQLWEEKGATILVGAGPHGAGVEPREAGGQASAEPGSEGAGVATREEEVANRHLAERRVRPNAATEAVAHLESAAAARDFHAMRTFFSDTFLEIDHPTGSEYGPDAAVASTQRLFRSRDPFYRMQPMATLGQSLVLARRRAGASGAAGERYDVGAYETEVIQLCKVDEHGRLSRSEVFVVERLGDAIARLYECYAEELPEGWRRVRAVTMASALRFLQRPLSPDRPDTVMAPGVEMLDNRTLGTWKARGLDAVLEQLVGLEDVAYGVEIRDQEILALAPDGYLARKVHLGLERVGGGSYERPYLAIQCFGSDGRMNLQECFDVGDEARALSRFDELVLTDTGGDAPASDARTSAAAPAVSAAPSPRFGNAAERFGDRIVAAWDAHDWLGLARLLDDDFLFADRRRLVQLELDRDGWVEMTQRFGSMSSADIEVETLATRGERLVLWRVWIEVAGGDVGPSQVEHLNVFETNQRGDLLVAGVRFDADDLDAAYAELDARFEAGEGETPSLGWTSLRSFVGAVGRRDWDAVVALCADAFVEHDHRSLAVLGTTLGAEDWVRNFRVMVDLASDTVYRAHHVRVEARGYYVHGGWYGTREGGPFEIPLNAVIELDGGGLYARADIYDDTGVEAALSRLAELGSSEERDPGSTVVPANKAAAMMERWAESYRIGFETGDWEPMRRDCAPDVTFEDRRRMMLLAGGLDMVIASARERAAMGALPELTIVGTAGDRIAVSSMLWSGGPSDGPFEIEYLALGEWDEEGRVSAFVLMDSADPRAAQREAWARWAAIDPTAGGVLTPLGEVIDAFNEQDPVKGRAVLANELVVEDHRLAGIGRLEGADAYVASVVALWELAPVTYVEGGWHWPAFDHYGAVTALRRTGTLPDGGDFEI